MFNMSTENVQKKHVSPPNKLGGKDNSKKHANKSNINNSQVYQDLQGPKLFQDYGPDEVECTFKPKINPISRSMATYLKPLQTEEGINFYLDRKNKKLEELKAKIEKEEEVKLAEYFENLHSNATNKGNKKIDREEVSERLIQGGIKMEEKKRKFIEQYTNETCPFIPNKDKIRKDPPKGIGSFLKRNQSDIRMRELKHQKVVLCDKNDMELKGKDASRAKSRINSRESSVDPIKKGRELYEKGIQIHKKNEEARKRPMTPPPLNEKTKVANDKYFKKLMSRRFEDLFFLLESKQTGILTSKNIDLEAINPVLLRVLSLMLFEIEDYSLVLNISQFVRACTNLYEVTMTKKRALDSTTGTSC